MIKNEPPGKISPKPRKKSNWWNPFSERDGAHNQRNAARKLSAHAALGAATSDHARDTPHSSTAGYRKLSEQPSLGTAAAAGNPLLSRFLSEPPAVSATRQSGDQSDDGRNENRWSGQPPSRKTSHRSVQAHILNVLSRRSSSHEALIDVTNDVITGIYYAVLETKPQVVQAQVAERYGKKGISDIGSMVRTWVKEWTKHWGAHGGYYENTELDEETRIEKGKRKLIKDAIKYHLHKQFGWQTVGAAAFMTGDAPSLALSAAYDPKLTIKIFQGTQPNSEDRRDFVEGRESALFSLFKTAEGRKQIRRYNTDSMSRWRELGPSALYAERYNPHTYADYKNNAGKSKYANKKIYPTKIWNKEIPHSTEANANALRRNLAAIKTQIDQLLTPQSESARSRVRSFKNTRITAKIKEFKQSGVLEPTEESHVILIWGRSSGGNAGAHPDLDSNPRVTKQIINSVRQSYPNDTIVLLGDEIIKQDELDNEFPSAPIIKLDQFWKKDSVFDDRTSQYYLVKLLADDHDAVSIGMRSGSLEPSALLGVNTIYVDDLGNNAEERMELLAGRAAYKRSAKIDRAFDDLCGREKRKQGPLINYKRVGTLRQLGSEEKKRTQTLQALKNEVSRLLADPAHTGNDAKKTGQLKSSINSLITNKKNRKAHRQSRERAKIKKAHTHDDKLFESMLDSIKKDGSLIDKAMLTKLSKVVDAEIAREPLSDAEIRQITFLVQYLRKQARRSTQPSMLSDQEDYSSDSHDSAAEISPPISPLPARDPSFFVERGMSGGKKKKPGAKPPEAQ